ncbi:MAG: SAM-dependent methyltransferase [Candidatus Krumholzibacteriia bacterium]
MSTPGPDLYLCRPGYEPLLAAELADAGLQPDQAGPGRLWAAGDLDLPGGPAFSHLILHGPTALAGEGVNALARAAAEFLLESLRGERVQAAWPCAVAWAPEPPGLARRAAAVRAALLELLQRRVARVAKLAVADMPRGGGPADGLWLYLPEFGRAWAARRAWSGGQRRMADDPAAPSRSYLKVEEAYGVLGEEPQAGQTVCDLGAAPGGWSYSAARRGARVTAVDNGPLKGGALGHPLIAHVRADAFAFAPAAGETCDWLFCDLVEEPHRVLRGIVAPWLEGGRCRRFVVNLKVGRADTAALLRELRAPGSPLRRHAPDTRIRHLHHDRDELTLVGRTGGAAGSRPAQGSG